MVLLQEENWVWWAFLIHQILQVCCGNSICLCWKLWRRSKVLTDLEFYELRYSGKGKAFLRGFRAFYLGAVFNILIILVFVWLELKSGVRY